MDEGGFANTRRPQNGSSSKHVETADLQRRQKGGKGNTVLTTDKQLEGKDGPRGTYTQVHDSIKDDYNDASLPLSSESHDSFDSGTTLGSLEPPCDTQPEQKSSTGHSIYVISEFEDGLEEPLSRSSMPDDFSATTMPLNDSETFDAEATGLATDLQMTEDLEESQELSEMPTEIHILGIGTVGKFVAHGLAGLPNPPKITLLMQRPLLMQQWHDEGAALTLLKDGRLDTRRGFNIESSAKFRRLAPGQRFPGFGPNLEHTAEPPTTAIDTLIVTTASRFTVPALISVRDRLRPSSSICLIQEGMGIVESLNTIVFPDPNRRPTYILGYLSNASSLRPSDKTFTIEQKGDVKITCSKQPQRSVSPANESGFVISRTDHSWHLPAAFLVGSLSRVAEFNTETIAHNSFTRGQLQRVIAHSVIGPMSVLHDCSNQYLLSNQHVRLAMRYVLEEISDLVLAFPELQGLRRIKNDFSAKKLESLVKNLLQKNMDMSTSMLENVRAGKGTDIDQFTGYLLMRAAELGIACPRMEMLFNMVKAKQKIRSRALDAFVPFTGG